MRIILPAVAGAALALSAPHAAAQARAAEKQVALTIESQTLEEALNQWSAQTGFKFLSPNLETAKRLPAPRVTGLYSAREALEKLLAGSPFTYVWLRDGVVKINERAQAPPKWDTTGADGTPTPMPSTRLRPSDAGGGAGAGGIERRTGGKGTVDHAGPRTIDVVVVTGTNIRGTGSSPSPIQQYTRDDIRRSGAHTAERFVQMIPQNFGGGISARNLGGPADSGGENASLNINLATGANLRGLGNSSTLVLLNGRRLAPAGLGYSVDLSLVPVGAIEQIEVLTDGASAIYK